MLSDHFWESCGYPITDTRASAQQDLHDHPGRRDPRAHHLQEPGLAHHRRRPAARLRAVDQRRDHPIHVPPGACGRRLHRHRPSAVVRPDGGGCAVDPGGARRRDLQSQLRRRVRSRRRHRGVGGNAGARQAPHRLRRRRRAFRHAGCGRRLGDGQGRQAGAGAASGGTEARRLLLQPGTGDPRHRGQRRRGDGCLLAAVAVVAVGAGTGAHSAHGQDLQRVTLPLDAFGEDGYFRITVSDDRGRRAWSNPIWR